MSKIAQWLRNKFGRIVTAVGAVLSGVETFDISAIKDPLEGLVGHKAVMGITVALFVLSWVRHQQVAALHPKPVVVPAPAPEAVVKP